MSMNQKLVEDNMGLVYFLINRYYPTFIADEDIVQCGMLGLCRAAKSYKEDEGVTFSSYASTCIINEIKDEFIRRNRHRGLISLDAKCFSSEGEDKTVADFVVGEEDVEFFDCAKFYDSLQPKDREVVDLKRMGLTGREIAELKGCSSQAVNQRLRRLRHKWRELYGD